MVFVTLQLIVIINILYKIRTIRAQETQSKEAPKRILAGSWRHMKFFIRKECYFINRYCKTEHKVRKEHRRQIMAILCRQPHQFWIACLIFHGDGILEKGFIILKPKWGLVPLWLVLLTLQLKASRGLQNNNRKIKKILQKQMNPCLNDRELDRWTILLKISSHIPAIYNGFVQRETGWRINLKNQEVPTGCKPSTIACCRAQYQIPHRGRLWKRTEPSIIQICDSMTMWQLNKLESNSITPSARGRTGMLLQLDMLMSMLLKVVVTANRMEPSRETISLLDLRGWGQGKSTHRRTCWTEPNALLTAKAWNVWLCSSRTRQ